MNPASRVALVAALVSVACPRVGSASPLEFVAPLLGAWVVPAGVVAERPELGGRVIHDYAWAVGRNAMQLREGYALGARHEAELEGLLYWDPSNETVGFTAVAGPGPDQGRVFRGTYRGLEDGRIERVYDVHYRTAADTPGGEELGGRSRRFREVYSVKGDVLTATLDWWLQDSWQPFGPGKYRLERAPE